MNSIERGEREGAEIPCSAEDQVAGLLLLRLSEWRREGGGIVDLCLRLVDSRVRSPVGAGRVVVAASSWNKVAAGASPPSRRRHVWRCRRALGFWGSRILRFGESWCSWLASRGGGGGRLLELLSPVSVSVSVRLALALPWSFWGWCSGVPTVVRCLYSAWICRRRCSCSGAGSEDAGGSYGCSPSTLLAKIGGALFQEVRGVSPAAVVHRLQSRRPRARRVSLQVLQLMLSWSLGVRSVRFAVPALLFLRSFPDRSVVCVCVDVVMLL